MSVENVKKFYEAVSQDEAMQQKFMELSQKYQGQQMDEGQAMSVMEQEGLPMAAQMGYSFTMGELKAYGEEMKQAKMNCELSEEELQAVTGGGMLICALIGIASSGGEGFCFLFGIGHSSYGSAACFIGGGGSWI